MCCGASDWAKTIAEFQIIGNAVGFCKCFHYMVTELYGRPENAIWLLFAIGYLNFAIIGFIGGFVLLEGAKRKNVTCLRRWCAYASIGFLVYLNVLLGGIMMSFPAIYFVLLPLFWTIFEIIIVGMLIDEIEGRTRQPNPASAGQPQQQGQTPQRQQPANERNAGTHNPTPSAPPNPSVNQPI